MLWRVVCCWALWVSHVHLHVRDHNVGWRCPTPVLLKVGDGGASTSVIQSFLKLKLYIYKSLLGCAVLLWPSPLPQF